MEPIVRTTARVLPVSDDGRVLLLEFRDPARPDDWHWITVGGAVEPGESLADGALRELWEETGIVAASDQLTGVVHHGTYAFSWAGVDHLSESSFFALPLSPDVAVSFDRLEPAEVGNVRQAAWWSPDDLQAAGTAASDDMPIIMRAAIAAVEGQQ